MTNTVLIKRSGTSSVVPSALESGEIAINYADGKLFYKNSSNSIVGSRLISDIVGTNNQVSVSESSGTFTLSLPSSVYVSSLFVNNIEIDTSGATPNYALVFNGTKFVPADISSGGEAGAPSAYSSTIGNGSSTSYILTHNLETRDLVVVARNATAPYEVIDVNWQATSTNTTTIIFSSAPASNSVRITIYAAGGTAGVTSVNGTNNQIDVTQTTGSVTVSLSNNLTVPGNLSVTGSVLFGLDALNDINISSATPEQFLKWNGSNWVNANIPQINALDDIGNVAVGTATSGQFLKYDGSSWINDSIPTINNLDDIGDVLAATPSTNQVLLYNGSTWIASSLAGATGSAYAVTIGNGSLSTFTITHNLGTKDLFVSFREAGDDYEPLNVAWKPLDDSSIEVTFDSAPTSNSVRALIYSSVSSGNGTTYTTTIGNGSDTEITVTHNLGTRNIIPICRLASSPYGDVQVSWEALTDNTVKFYFGSAPDSNSIQVVVFSSVSGSEVGQSIESLTNTNITSLTSGQFLKWNGSVWINDVIDLGSDTTGNYLSEVSAGTGISVSHIAAEGSTATVSLNASLNDLTDAIITSPLPQQSLVYNGANWVNDYANVAIKGHNAELTTLTTGTIVYISGATGDKPSIKRATNIDGAAERVLGMVSAPILAGGDGVVVTIGIIQGLNLGSYLEGDILWLGTNGAFTKIEPVAPAHRIYLGVVVRAINGNGIAFIKPEINFGLEEVQNVLLSSPNSGEFLKYNGTVWVNDLINLGTDTTGDYVQSIVAGTGISISNNSGEGATPTITNTGVVSVNGSSGVITGIATTSGNLSQFASTTSSQLAGIMSDETGSGSLVFGTSPTITTSLLTGSASFDFINTTATTINFAGAATTLNIGAATGTTTIGNNLIVTGDLTVSGTTTTVNTTELLIEDNLIVLNTGSSATPSFNAGLEIERGNFTNVQIRWNESTDKWQFTNDGTTYKDLGSGGVTVSDTIPSSPAQGDMWYESDTGALFAYYDSFWIEIGGTATYNEIIGTIQAKGDLLVGNASQSLTRLPLGTDTKRLAANSSTSTGLEWIDDSVNTVVDARGDILIGATPNLMARLPVGSNNQTLVSDSTATNGISWQTIVATGAYSNIYSNSLSTGTATIVFATRTYNGKHYTFSNLTFNMPSNINTDASDWTAPVDSNTYKWSYVYIRSSDNKFYISNNAPSSGLNYRTIGGNICLYLFPVYTSSTIIANFQLNNNRYSCEQASGARTTYRTSDTGVGLNYDWGGGNRTTGTYDAVSKIPTTATELYVGFRNSYGWRADSANTYYYSISMEVQNKSNTWTTVYTDDGYMYCKTPDAGGGYYLRTVNKPVELTLSTNVYNFAATRMTWSHSATTSDADTGAGFWLKGFNDGNIF